MTHPSSERPLSPHIQVYKPQITSVLSITHRATGVALWLGSLLMISWLWAVAYSTAENNLYDCIMQITAHPVAKLLLMGWTFALCYHLANGIRHLFWDIGRGFDLCSVTKSGVLVVVLALGGTAAIWCCIIDKFGF